MQNLKSTELIGAENRFLIEALGGGGDVSQSLTMTKKYLIFHYYSQPLKGMSKKWSKILLTLVPNISCSAQSRFFKGQGTALKHQIPYFMGSESLAQGKERVRKEERNPGGGGARL